jgi:hypothetical protein
MSHLPFSYENTHTVVGCVQIIAPCSRLILEFGADMLAARASVQIRLHDAPCDTTNATLGDSDAAIEVWQGDITAPNEGVLLPNVLLPASMPGQTIHWATSFTAGQSVSIAIGSAIVPISSEIRIAAS